MSTNNKEVIEKFNTGQIRYFERFIKRTMVPREDRYLRRHVEEAVRFAEILPGDRILEVGCGMGRYTFILARMGFRVEGLDLTPWLLDRLKEYNAGRYDIPLHCADIQKPLPELEGKFDAVLGFFTLHHVLDINISYQTMARLVKPGGKIVFIEPNPYNILYYIQIMTTPGMTWKGDGGIIRMRKGIILGAMQEAGLSRLKMSRFGFFPPFITNTWWGSTVEAVLEKLPLLKPMLPFQLFRGDRIGE